MKIQEGGGGDTAPLPTPMIRASSFWV